MRAITKIYLLMLALVIAIATVFIVLYIKDKKEEDLLKEKGITVQAWITNLTYSKASKKSTAVYYMEVAFFSDSTKTLPDLIDTTSKSTNPVDAILDKIKIDIQPTAGYIKSKIEIPQALYQFYKVNDKVKVIFLKEDPKIIRLIGKVNQ